MSKFWDEESEEEEDEGQQFSGEDSAEEEEGSEDEQKEKSQQRKFDVYDFDSSSDEKRAVLTSSQKLQNNLLEKITLLNGAMAEESDLKIVPEGTDKSQWPMIPNLVDAKEHVEAGLQLLDKYKKAVKDDGVPGFFIRALAKFIEAVNKVNSTAKNDKVFKDCIPKDTYKHMTNALRFCQKTLESGKFGKDIEQYQKDPTNDRWLDPAAKEEKLEEESEDEDEKDKKSGPKRGTREFWVKQPGDTSSEEEDEDDGSWLDELSGEGAEEDIKKEEKPKEFKDRKAKPGAKTKTHKGKSGQKLNKEEGDSEEEEEESNEEVKMKRSQHEPLEEEKELKSEDVDRLTLEMLQLRGRKGTDYPRLLQRLELIVPKAKTDIQRIRLLILFINTRFDSVRSTKSRLSAKDWRASVENIKQILEILRANPTFRLIELENRQELEEEEEGEPSDQDEKTKKEKLDKAKGVAATSEAAGKTVISGSLFALLERLDTAFIKTLQQIDPHTQEYVTRLADDPDFIVLAKDMLKYQKNIQDFENATKTAHQIMTHIYFRCYESTKNAEGVATSKRVNYTKELQEYATLIYEHGGARRKAQAMLMCIYHFALQDDFQESRDRMLMSHLQDKAAMMDIETQVLFNRTNVQIGLCAFRNGFIKEAHSALSEIYAGGRVKELLAQGTSSQRYQDKDKEQEKVEKSRMMPYHMHINLDLLETCHLIAAMMLEVPAMAAERYNKGSSGGVDTDRSNKVMSKYLRKLVDYHERQVFAGPPETTRDFVVAAARALSRGNWKKTSELLLNMAAWELLDNKDKVKSMLSSQVQEVGLKTYLFTYCSCFETLSLSMLAELFEMSESRVHAIVSGMMLNDELKASWNQPTKTIVMHHVEPTSLQNSAMKYTHRIAAFLESNEALLESRHYNKFEGKQDMSGKSRSEKEDYRKDDYVRNKEKDELREFSLDFDEETDRNRFVGNYKKLPFSDNRRKPN